MNVLKLYKHAMVAKIYVYIDHMYKSQVDTRCSQLKLQEHGCFTLAHCCHMCC